MNEDQKMEAIKQLELQAKLYGLSSDGEKMLDKLRGGDWSSKVNACTSKAKLEALVMEEKGIDIDKRKKLSDLKEEALAL